METVAVKKPKGWDFTVSEDHSTRRNSMGWWCFDTDEHCIVIGSWPDIDPVVKDTLSKFAYRIHCKEGTDIYDCPTKFGTLEQAQQAAMCWLDRKLQESLAKVRGDAARMRIVAKKRLLIVNDGSAWFIRDLMSITHELESDHKIYRCENHLGGPFTELDEAVAAAKKLQPEKSRRK